MPVSFILSQVGRKIGLNPNAEGDRNVLLRFLNEAAEELWVETDITGSLMEQVFKVNGDQTISMPMSVGPVRAVRDFNSQKPYHINQMRPRYNEYNWKDGWYNYRLRNTQALQRTISNAAPVVINVAVVESIPIVVSITGSTEIADRVTDNIAIDANIVYGTVAFIDIIACTRSALGQCDIIVSDVDGNQLTNIPNSALEAKYQILDISAAPWLSTSIDPLSNYVEILYKKALPWLYNDGDEFPAQGYDNQLVDKCLQLYYQEQGNVEMALNYDAKATRGLARKKEDQNKATEDQVAFVEDGYSTMMPRIRGVRWTRWNNRRRIT